MQNQSQQAHYQPDTSLRAPRYHPTKKFNIVVYGVEELPAKTNRSKRQQHDLEKVVIVLKTIENSIEDEAIRDVRRLGMYEEVREHPRPILVEFVRSMDVSRILEKNSGGKLSKQVVPYFIPEEMKMKRKSRKDVESQDSTSDYDTHIM